MTDRQRFAICSTGGVVALIVLISATVVDPFPFSHLGFILAFGALITFAMSYSIPLGGGQVSLMPMSIAAAYLIHGHVLTGWIICVGMLGHAGVRYLRSRRPELHDPTGWLLVELTITNITMHVISLMIANAIYRMLRGAIPLTDLDIAAAGRLLVFGAVYMATNHVLVGGYLALRGLWKSYIRSLAEVLLYEAGPLVFAPLVTLIYTRLGAGYFTLFALALCLSSLISHNLALTSQRLQRRLQELSSLQAVGEVLSRSLDLDVVVNAVYEQVARLVPANSFYIALYDSEYDEVSFPIVVNAGERKSPVARRARRGLTEYVLETAQPLLLQGEVGAKAAALGLEQIGKPAACWLGIPIVAGDKPLGMFTVQSYDDPSAYDESHLAVLQAIAAQAAIAIQNAHLYERTDEALTRRVQELDSVLRTTQDGILLLDTEFYVLAGNRAFADFLRVAQLDLSRHRIDAPRDDAESLIDLIGTTLDRLRADTDRLRAGDIEQISEHITLVSSKIPVEQTITPVRDGEGAISGWLLVFRDMTEELELAQLRDDLTHMLVHDLRSPLAVVQASLDMLAEAHESQDTPQVEQLVDIGLRNCDHILHMVDQLLDIGRLEQGQLALHKTPVPVRELLDEVHVRLTPVANANRIRFEVKSEDTMPCVFADRSLMIRVLSNLVDNALKFTPDGGTIIIRACQPSSEPRISISVQDTGPGIPIAAQSRLFQKFQSISEIPGRRRGSGLGLFFCKLVIEAHDGRIDVESTVGKGSTFSVTLPTEAPAQ